MHPSIYRLPPAERPEKFESDQRGKLRERAFIHAWQDITAWPRWMIRAPTKAPKLDDEYRGIDVYFHTDVGDIPIQIKGSVARFVEYVRDDRHGNVTAVIVYEGHSAEEIRGYTLKPIKKGYEIAKQRQRDARRAQLANT